MEWHKTLRECEAVTIRTVTIRKAEGEDIAEVVRFYRAASNCVRHSLHTVSAFQGYVSKISGDWHAAHSFAPIIQAAQEAASKFTQFEDGAVGAVGVEPYRAVTHDMVSRLKRVVTGMLGHILAELETRADGFAPRLTALINTTIKELDDALVHYRQLVDGIG